VTVEPLTHNPFWDFSLALYADEEVARYSLELQDDWDADVNLLLYGIWLAHHGIAWQSEEVKALQAEFEPWRKMTLLPLRTVRRRLHFETRRRYYNFVKKLELRAERHQQDRLWQRWQREHADSRPVKDDVFSVLLQGNLQIYLQRLEMRPRAQSMRPKADEQLAKLIAAVRLQRNISV
jgi:uncharacterized protein (TIGR02444 family)